MNTSYGVLYFTSISGNVYTFENGATLTITGDTIVISGLVDEGYTDWSIYNGTYTKQP
jgi:hypothetical protein